MFITFQYKCTYNLILHNKSSPDLQLGTIEKKPERVVYLIFPKDKQTYLA